MTYKRKEQIGDCTLYLGDCLEILPDMESVASVVCDPPYGIGFRYERYNDDSIKYEALMRTVVNDCLRICEGPQFWFQGMPQAGEWHKWFPDGFRLMAACKGFVQMRKGHVQWAHDPVVFWEGEGPVDETLRDWIYAGPEFHQGKIDHPCPRPLGHMKQIVQAVNGMVLDPFMGSGTTGVACAKLGRSFSGIEIDDAYFDTACQRIDDAYRQGNLFSDEA